MIKRAPGLIAVLALAATVGFHLPAGALSPVGNSVSETGTVSGTVTGPDGKGDEGLHISIMPSRHATTTVTGGFFIVEGMEPGVYSVVVSLDGRTLQSRKGVRVTGQRTTHIDLAIAPRSLLKEHGRLLALVGGGVVCIVLSVVLKQAVDRRCTARSQPAGHPAGD